MAGTGDTNTYPDQKPMDPWFGYERFSSTLGAYPVEVIEAPITWDERHVERLLKTSETPGLVPTLSANLDKGRLQLAQLQIFSPTLHQRLAMSRNLRWEDATGLITSTARAVDNGHLLGLRHGGLSPQSVSLSSEAVSVKGMGLGRGGTVPEDLSNWVAPEVLAGETPGVRSDVYSLGKLLESALASAKGASPAALAAIVEKATDADYMNRHRTAAEFAEELATTAGPTMATYALANFGATAMSGVPVGLPISVGLFSDDTFIDLTDAKPDIAAGDPNAVAIVPDARPVIEPRWSAAAAEELAGNRAGWGALIGLLGLGALIVAGALLIGSGDSDSSGEVTTTATTTEARTTTAVVTTEVEPTTTVTAPATTAPATTAPATTAPATTAPATTAPATTAPATTAPATTAPATVGESPVELVHGIPSLSYDVYSNGQLLVDGFAPQTIAGPVDLAAGAQSVEVFEAMADPPAIAQDRDDQTVVSRSLDLTADQATTVAAHLDASGQPVLSAFADNRLPIPAGKSRLSLRHLAAAGPVQVVIDGEPAGPSLSNGEDLEFEVSAGQHDVVLLDADGNEVLAARLDASEGSATTVSVVTGSDGELVAIVQRFDGLDTAPGEVPTGDSGLKVNTDTSVVGLVLALAGIVTLSGAAGATWQRRRTR